MREASLQQRPAASPLPHEERAAREAGFLEAAGLRMALFGAPEAGFECWMWPLKVLHGLRLVEQGGGALAATRAVAEPHGFTLHYTGGAALHVACAPESPAAVLRVTQPGGAPPLALELLADLAPMWPAGLGARVALAIEDGRGLALTEELGRFAVRIGGPDVRLAGDLPERGFAGSPLRLDLGPGEVCVVIAGASLEPAPLSEAARRGEGQAARGLNRAGAVLDAAARTWRAVLEDPAGLFDEARAARTAAAHGGAVLASDRPELAQACAWARHALDRLEIEVPDVGRSLVAGIGPSGAGERPGFAWFFDSDAFVAARAYCALGDFPPAARLLVEAARHQRADGKIMHERTLSARLVRWLEDYPYAFYKADATPGFLGTLALYLRSSGDLELCRELLPAARAAFEWCAERLGPEGLLSNRLAGIAAVEAGELSDAVEHETYLNGLWLEACAGAAELARALDEPALEAQAEERLDAARRALETLWSETAGRYAFGRLRAGELFDARSAYTATPLALGFGEPRRALATALDLNHPDVAADWGVRMFARSSSVYAADCYNTGSVFPFLTQFTAAALYRGAACEAAYQVLSAQVALTGLEAAGFVPEHLEGDLCRTPARGVPHQAFSSAAVLQGVVHGMLGWDPDATRARLRLAPALPLEVSRLALTGARVADTRLDVQVERAAAEGAHELRATFEHLGGAPLHVAWRPLLPPLSTLEHVTLDGPPVHAALVERESGALELELDADLRGPRELAVRYRSGPLLGLETRDLTWGAESRAVRLVGQEARGGRIRYRLAGPPGPHDLRFACDLPFEVRGAERGGPDRLTVVLDEDGEVDVEIEVQAP